jgi:D-alanyl-lipoteichoic acid acyltransferase DltB (MBOAT superfamily)
MLFNSFEFLSFFLVVFATYFFIPGRLRWVQLLTASYLFYMAWNPACVVLILTSTATAYLTGIGIAGNRSRTGRKALLLLCLTVNLGLLLAFKYLDFAISILLDAAGIVGWQLDLPYANLILPVGISFYTFQTLSYTFDLYRNASSPEFHPGRFALFVNFFPQLVAGPIERSGDLLPQFRRETRFEYTRVRDGFLQALWGAYKKICIADLVAGPAGRIFAEPESFNGTLLAIGVALFCVQVYCDFSGYSDIAIGLARIFGYDLITNFRQPYTARSVAEFWRRWHVSLGNWFRDYIYIPLGGNRRGPAVWARNTLLVFLVSGIWHGAAWTFVVFGLIHGSWILLERPLFGWTERFRGAVAAGVGCLRWAVTQLVVAVSFTVFASRSLQDCAHILSHVPRLGSASYLDIASIGLPNFSIALVFWHVALLAVADVLARTRPAWYVRLCGRGWARLAFALLLTFSIGMFGVFERVDFIYFQF